jgi:hypothetical protein
MMAELRIATPRNMRASHDQHDRSFARCSTNQSLMSFRSCGSQSQIIIAPAIAIAAGGMNNDVRQRPPFRAVLHLARAADAASPLE